MLPDSRYYGQSSGTKQSNGSPSEASLFSLCRTFALQSSAHGLRRAASTRCGYTRFFWLSVFFLALVGCTFHCNFLIQNFLEYPRVTITEEKHAEEISFPSLTVCNLNVLKKSYIKRQFAMLRELAQMKLNSASLNLDLTAFCYHSIDEFLNRSKAWDLSDIWMSLTVTRDSLLKYGHQTEDFLVHCSYNARNCFNSTNPIVQVTPYPSPRYGLCHTFSVNHESLQNVAQPGLSLGLRLTLNIQRDEYLHLLSPEYGARLIVHPAGTYPTLQRGGVVLQPGTKTYVSVRMRKIDRLPWPYGDCTKEFDSSPLSGYLKKMGQTELLKHRVYTYEYCQTLCRDAFLLKFCDCSEESTQGNSRYCDPCNVTQATCRTNFLRRFNRNFQSDECNDYCKPACTDIRYDLTVSRSEWPNPNHHWYVLKRWPAFRTKFGGVVVNSTFQGETPAKIDVEHIRQNFLRVHVFIQEMNFLSVKDVPAYTVVQLFADLGGCLGLYIGVSLITVLEVFDLFKSIAFMIQHKWKIRFSTPKSSKATSTSTDAFWVSIQPPQRHGLAVPKRDHRGYRVPKTKRHGKNGITSCHLSRGYVSPVRQLPSPIFSKDYDGHSRHYPAY